MRLPLLRLRPQLINNRNRDLHNPHMSQVSVPRKRNRRGWDITPPLLCLLNNSNNHNITRQQLPDIQLVQILVCSFTILLDHH